MSLKDYFAAKAMQSMCNPEYKDRINKQYPNATPEQIESCIAEAAYIQAEAMLAEREKRLKQQP